MPCRSNVKEVDDYSSRGCNGTGKQQNYMRNSQCLSLIANHAILQANRRNGRQRAMFQRVAGKGSAAGDR